jgi:transcriptional regulator with XRE-family HTH domain
MDERTVSQTFGERVRRRRMMLGWSQRTLAEQIKAPPDHVSKMERGVPQTVILEELYRLVVELQTSADYLLGLSDEPGVIPPHLYELVEAG